MKMEKHWKRFFTLDRHHAEGFTLVELIVVIAILAILAGVAVPAYSGYIAKANMVGDLQLLDTMTTAFHSACIEENISILDLEGTKVVLNEDKTFGGFDFSGANVDLSATLSAAASTTDDPFTATFKVYFGNDSLNQAFTVITDIVFRNGAFVDASTLGGVFTDIFNALGDKITASVNKVTGSTFGEIGAEDLMGKVDTVTNLAAGLAGINSDFKNVLANNSASMAEALGYDLPDQEKEYTAKMMEMVNQIAPGTVVDGEVVNSDAFNEATNQILANYAVLEAAKSTTKTSDELLGELQSGINTEDIKNLMTSKDTANTQEGLSKAAMMYAMYTAYANQLPEGAEKEEALESAQTVEGFLANMESEGFQAYLKEDSAKTDLEGYLGALDIINQSAESDPDAVSDLLVNGYTDPDLVDALQGLLGK